MGGQDGGRHREHRGRHREGSRARPPVPPLGYAGCGSNGTPCALSSASPPRWQLLTREPKRGGPAALAVRTGEGQPSALGGGRDHASCASLITGAARSNSARERQGHVSVYG